MNIARNQTKVFNRFGPVVDNDLDNDGHDDTTGEFVEGNQEAADEEVDEPADVADEEELPPSED